MARGHTTTEKEAEQNKAPSEQLSNIFGAEEEAEHHEEHDTELEGNEQSEGVGSGYSGIETKELKDICVKATASIDEKLRSGELDPAVLAAVVEFAAKNLGKESEMAGKKPSGKGFG